MSGAYIKEVRVQGFGCVEDATLKLTRLHALIGPNDSGKTTLMRAVRTALEFASGGFWRAGNPSFFPLQPFEPGVRHDESFSIRIETEDDLTPQLSYELDSTYQSGSITESAMVAGSVVDRSSRSGWDDKQSALAFQTGLPQSSSLLGYSSQWLHLISGAISDDSKLFSEGERKILDPSGSRLPAVYDAILNRGDDTFLRIADEVRRFFPPIKSIRLKNVAPDTKAFEIELSNGKKVPASFISDGVLYFLAFAALEHTDPASVLLIEEPENGLHPSRIADVMRVLRRLSERVQIVVATHSPFVINELQGDEVTVVTRPEGKGTQVRRLCDTPNFEERSKVYALGELWVSYADGKDEHALLSPPDAAE